MNNSTPFSVLLSVYHRENPNFMDDSLNSIFQQTIMPNEVILVQDGPLNNELYGIIEKYLQKYPTIFKTIPLPTNQGLGNALNVGLQYCSYDLVARMDTDDICLPNRFEQQLQFMQQHPEIDVVGGWTLEFINSLENIIAIRQVPYGEKQIKQYFKRRNPLNHPTVMFRKNAVLQAGGYLDLDRYEDYYLWVRMLKNGANFDNIPQPLIYFRTSEDTFVRRGGIKYLKSEITLFNYMYHNQLISLSYWIYDIGIRIIIRVMPNQFRKYLYKIFLRKQLK